MSENMFYPALDIIRDGGLCKNVMEEGTKHCVFGALHNAYYTSYTGAVDMLFEHTEMVNRVARELFPDRVIWDIPGYNCYGEGSSIAANVNNHPDTTQEDVELILKHAAYEWDLLHI